MRKGCPLIQARIQKREIGLDNTLSYLLFFTRYYQRIGGNVHDGVRNGALEILLLCADKPNCTSRDAGIRRFGSHRDKHEIGSRHGSNDFHICRALYIDNDKLHFRSQSVYQIRQVFAHCRDNDDVLMTAFSFAPAPKRELRVSVNNLDRSTTTSKSSSQDQAACRFTTPPLRICGNNNGHFPSSELAI